MRTIFLVLLLACTLCSRTLAQPHLNFDRIAVSRAGAAAGLPFRVDATMLAQFAGQRLIIDDFPISYSERSSITLAPGASPINSDTRIVGSHASAGTRAVWRGSIGAEKDSRVVIVVTNGYLFASIERNGLSPVMICPERRDHGVSLLISQSDLLSMDSAHPLSCLNEDLQQLDRPDIRSQTTAFSSGKPQSSHRLLEAQIAVEADSCFFAAAGGSVDLVEAYINALFAMSSAIYEDEAQITFHISWLKLWASGDPYNVKGNAYLLPDTVRSYWKTHYADVPRDLAHVMTSIGYGGGGFGWFGMCSTDYGYSVSSPRTHEPFPTFAFTYDAYIVSHEIGHNFGLPHSHSCYWNPPLDTCYTTDNDSLKLNDACYAMPVTPRKSPGTIMSYCANANYLLAGKQFSEYKLGMTFSQRVADTLRRNAELYTCITEPQSPTIRLVGLHGGTLPGGTLPGDTTVSVKWASAHVDKVTARYSTNGGATWELIADDVNATDGVLNWQVANVQTANALVLVSDVSNPMIADTSLLPFGITARADVASVLPVGIMQFTSHGIDVSATLVGAEYEIIDLLGNVIRHAEVDGSHYVDIHSLENGVFILRLRNHGQTSSYRFLR